MVKPSSLKDLCLKFVAEQPTAPTPGQLPNDLFEEVIAKLAALEPQKLCERGCQDKDTALLILTTECLYKKLGKNDHDRFFWANEYSRTGEAEPITHARHSGEYLFKLGKAHPEANRYILEQPKLKKRLSADQQQSLEASLNPEPATPVRSYGCR